MPLPPFHPLFPTLLMLLLIQQPPQPSLLFTSLFYSTNTVDWLVQADHFFQFYNIPWDSRLNMVVFYMWGDALSWFKWMYQNHQLIDWISFCRAIELHFGPSTYANHQVELFKLCQTGTVTGYQKVFEKLCNRVLGLTPEMILNCFIFDFTLEIRREMGVLQSTTTTTIPPFYLPFL